MNTDGKFQGKECELILGIFIPIHFIWGEGFLTMLRRSGATPNDIWPTRLVAVLGTPKDYYRGLSRAIIRQCSRQHVLLILSPCPLRAIFTHLP